MWQQVLVCLNQLKIREITGDLIALLLYLYENETEKKKKERWERATDRFIGTCSIAGSGRE